MMTETAASRANASRYDNIWNEAYGDMQEVGPVHRHMRRLLSRSLSALTYDSVVDVGCGAGHNLPLVCAGRRLKRVCGIDVSAEALHRARERSDAEFTQLDIETEALDARFDLVFSSLLLEHLGDDGAALRNMRAMAARDLIVATMAGDFDRYRAWEDQVGHVRNYGVGELERKLERAGFAVERAIYWGFPFYTPLARTLQNRMTSAPTYGRSTRAIAAAMYLLYFLNSSRRGDLLIVHARAG
jgi:SAM-dependent methyltransferase